MNRFYTVLAAGLVLGLLPHVAMADGDPAKGKRLFAQCGSCHAVKPGGQEKVGPNLHGIFGREAGQLEGFDYSDAMKASGMVWGAAEMDAFIANPGEFLPGTKMVFFGVSKEKDRRDIIAYLEEASK